MDFTFNNASLLVRFKNTCGDFSVKYEPLAPAPSGAAKFRAHIRTLSPVDLILFGSALGSIKHDDENFCRKLVA